MRVNAPWGRRQASILWRLARPISRVQPALRSFCPPQSNTSFPSSTTAIQCRALVTARPSNNNRRYAQWVAQYDSLLPSDLRSQKPARSNGAQCGKPAAFDIEKFLKLAKGDGRLPSDVLVWMVNNGRRKAALCLIHDAQKYVADHKRSHASKPPSNLDWPPDLFNVIKKSHVSVNDWKPASVPSQEDIPGLGLDDFALSQSNRLAITTEAVVWQNIAFLILSALDGPKNSPRAIQSMSAALLAIGSFHNLGLMPENVYSRPQQQHPSFVRKAPILHLLSSHILSALSDAAWREQQDDAIADARRKGQTLDEIARSVPGGRFRLKVPSLAPEIWLELVLSTCLELGHTLVARRVVAMLAERTHEPWHAFAWGDYNHSKELTGNHRLDMNVQPKPHTLDRPTIHVPDHTVSVEVILTLIDDLVNSIRVDHDPVPKHIFRPHVRDLVKFLAPHSLPPSYFDYLQTRLLHLFAFDGNRNPFGMHKWFNLVDGMRLLERVDDLKESKQSLSLDSIQVNSLLPLALHHQVMHAYIQVCAVHNALASFNHIQEWIDKNKFTSVMKFLQAQRTPHERFFDSYTFPNRLEFTDSHGQLPEPILAAFLNLISDNKIAGLGQWLVDSDDVDGALIPASIHKHPTMAAALYKFAAASGDPLFFDTLRFRRVIAKTRPTVRMLRAEVDAAIELEEFDAARTTLRVLRRVPGGGIGLPNIASIGAKILQLESNHATPRRTLSLAKWVLREALDGTYDCVRDDYTIHQRALYKQQISHLLRIFAALPSHSLHQHAIKYAPNFSGGNLVSLPAGAFNKILSSLVAVKGSHAGKWLWQVFCDEKRSADTYRGQYLLGMGDRNSEAPIPSLQDEDVVIGDSEYTEYAKVVFDSPISQPTNNNPSSDDHQSDNNLQLARVKPQDSLNGWPEDLGPGGMDGEIPISWGNETHPLLEPQVVTKPNLQTLRIIVRAAVDEMRAASGGIPLREATRMLGWARHWFHKMGVVHRDILEQEFEDSYTDNDSDLFEPKLEGEDDQSFLQEAIQKGKPSFQQGHEHFSTYIADPEIEQRVWESFTGGKSARSTPEVEQDFESPVIRKVGGVKPATSSPGKIRHGSGTVNERGEISQRWVPSVYRKQTVTRSPKLEQEEMRSR